MNLRIVETKDGLHSLYVPELDEHYHSTHGALQEAKHVFIDAGLRFIAESKKEISILEIGLGTGLNAFLTYLFSIENAVKVNYTGLELYPVPVDVAQQLNYCEIMQCPERKAEFQKLHQSEWGREIELANNFKLNKLNQSVFDFTAEEKFDLIYFDAFGFRAQEEMWGQAVFDKMFRSLRPGGILVTYSSKGEVRRSMQTSGFKVEKLAGPVGKREMVRAVRIKD